MKRVAAFILGILSVVSAGVWAVSGGGFPSRPTFQSLRVGTPTAVAFGSTDASSTFGSSTRNAALWNYSGASTGSMRILENVYYNGSAFIAINTGPSAQLNTEDGVICLETAASVTGGTTPTFGLCRFQADAVGNITIPNAVSFPIGMCSFSLTMAGALTPTIQSSRGCTSAAIVRNSVGSYNFNATNIQSGWTVVCDTDSSLGGPFVHTASTTPGATVLINIFTLAGALTDPPSGAHWRCATGS